MQKILFFFFFSPTSVFKWPRCSEPTPPGDTGPRPCTSEAAESWDQYPAGIKILGYPFLWMQVNEKWGEEGCRGGRQAWGVTRVGVGGGSCPAGAGQHHTEGRTAAGCRCGSDGMKGRMI